MGAPARELAHRHIIARAESEYKKALERADESAALAIQVQRDYESVRALTVGGLKNLERLEKLARRIRGYSGGSDDKAVIEDLPPDVAQSLTRLAEVSSRLHQEIERTSRQVVSAKIIYSANELLALVRHVRALAQP